MSGMGFPGPGCGPPGHNAMNQGQNFVSHMMKPMGMDMAPPSLNPCATGTCCGNACTFDCLCHLIDSDAKGIDVDDIYQVLGRDVLKSSVLDDIDLYLECDEDNVYNKAMPSKPGMESITAKNSQEPFKFKFSFPTNATPPVSDSKKSFVCEFCSQSFIKDHLLKNHQAKSHNVKDLFPCPQCAYRGQQHAHLQKHIKRMHKKSSSSDDCSNNLSQNTAILPPKSTDETSKQPSMLPISNPPGTLPQCNTAADIKPQENWPPVPNKDEPSSAPVQGPGPENIAQSMDTGNVDKIQFPGKTESFPPLPHQIESSQEQKVPIVYNRQQSTPSRGLGTEPSPGPRSVPESSPRPGSRQSGHESSTDFSILDISNNTFKAAETATFLPGESLLAQLEGHDIYGSPKVDQVPFAVPSPHSLPVHAPTPAANQHNQSVHMMNYGSPGVNMGQFHDRPPVLNRAQTFPIASSGNIPPALARSPSYPPRYAPTPPELSEQKRRKVSPVPHASGRTSTSSIGANSQGFASPSPTSCVPRIAPTPPDFSRPQMSPMSQGSSQHSSPTYGHVNQSFMSPSPPVGQPRCIPTPPAGIRHQMSPTLQRANQYQHMTAAGKNPGFSVQSPPAGLSAGPGSPMMLRHPYSPGIPPRMGSPQLDPTQPQMAQTNPVHLPSNSYRPSIQAQHVIGQSQQHVHPGQMSPGMPGQQFYPQNGPGLQGQYNITNQPPRYPYSGPRYPPHMAINVQGQNLMGAQRTGPGPSPSYPSPTGPIGQALNQGFVNTAGPDAGFPQHMQSHMYRQRQQQPIQRFTYQVQRHPHRAPYDASGGYQGMGQAQGNMQTFQQNVGPSQGIPGVHCHPMQQMRMRMVDPGQPNRAMNIPGRNVGYISGQEQRFYQPQIGSKEFQPPPVFSPQESNVRPGQEVPGSGMMRLHVSQGNTAHVAVHSNISHQLNSGIPQGQGNIALAMPPAGVNTKRTARKNKELLSQTLKGSQSSHIKHEGSVGGLVDQIRVAPVNNPGGLSFVQGQAVSEFKPQQYVGPVEIAGTKRKVSTETVDINENQNIVQDKGEYTRHMSVIESSGNNDKNVSVEKQTPDEEQVNERIHWLLMHCGVNKSSDSKSGNSEKCRLEIKTSEEEIGPVVHIMETQEVDGEMENILDDISRSESDATQSDSVLPVMSPQMNDDVFSPPCHNLDSSPPKLSRIDDSSDLKCDKCDYVCASKQLLKSHERHKHDPNRKTYKCDTCQVELKQKASYDSHMAKHNGEMKYECHVCHKSFANRLSFNLHLKTHNTERPFKCPVDMCDKVFRTKSDLNEHDKVVHGERIHKCSYPGCDKSYTLEKDLRAHQVSHTVALKCSWPRCRKTFRDRFNLNNHYKTHTKEKPIECPHCDFRCIQRASLESHMKNHHLGSA